MKQKNEKDHIYRVAIGFLCSLMIMVAAYGVFAADIAVIVNKNVTQDTLSEDNLKDIYLGRTTAWQNGTKVEFVILNDQLGIHEDFLKKYIGRSSAQYRNFWKKQVFTGKGRMPKQFDSEGKLLEYVSTTDGAIGYVLADTAKESSVKVLSINK
ncbi:MAG: substrate-binding domain-containing protein [Deltaproteobacteria bacterium]|nr:substrate-binding domain-containing protein [Deltaproteobacteria bacterium]